MLLFFCTLCCLTWLLLVLAQALLSHSLALLAFAFHVLRVALSLGVRLAAQRASHWPPSVRFPFGYARVAVVGEYAVGVLASFSVIAVALESVHRVFEPADISGGGMLVVGLLSLPLSWAAVAFQGPRHRTAAGGPWARVMRSSCPAAVLLGCSAFVLSSKGGSAAAVVDT
eukprot:RCo036725